MFAYACLFIFLVVFFFFNDTATTEIYTLSLHDALPIYLAGALEGHTTLLVTADQVNLLSEYMTLARLLQPSIFVLEDRKSTRLNSSHANISYAVFCLKKKKTQSTCTCLSATLPTKSTEE